MMRISYSVLIMMILMGKGATSSNKPPVTLPALLKYPPSCTSPDCKCINIVSRIAPRYLQFGTLLLNDDHGHIVDVIVHDHQGAEEITFKIFKRWINGEGLKPVSWETLVNVLQYIGLSELTKEIKELKSYEQNLN